MTAATSSKHRAPLGRVLAIGALSIGAALANTAAEAANLQQLDFLPAVQSVTQNARILLVNLARADGRVNLPPDPCRVAVTFLDTRGEAVGATQQFAIARGHTVAAAPVFLAAGVPSTLRAHVEVVTPSTVPPDPCHALHGSYEIYDTQTLETKLLNPGVIRGFNPQPDPPGVVGR